jgi:HK97 gp10 family phage protein
MSNRLFIKLNKLKDFDIKKPLTEAGLLVEREAKKNCPVNTGNLRDSIKSTVDGDTATIGTNVEYGIYTEMGTGLYAVNGDGRQDVPWAYKDEEGNFHFTNGIHPQPYLLPALDDNRDAIKNIFDKAIKEAISG